MVVSGTAAGIYKYCPVPGAEAADFFYRVFFLCIVGCTFGEPGQEDVVIELLNACAHIYRGGRVMAAALMSIMYHA